MIKVEGICKRYNKETVLSNVSCYFTKGEIVYLLGPNGAGKTTLLKSILGLCKTEGGTIDIEKGVKIGALIGVPVFHDELNAYENLRHYAYLINFDNHDREIRRVLEMVGLEPDSKKNVKKFSTGMRERLGVARALMGNPDVVILDEPINGLDPIGIADMRTIIEQLHREGKTVIVSSHIISESENLALRYIILNKGKVLEDFPVESIGKIYEKYNIHDTNMEGLFFEILKGGDLR